MTAVCADVAQLADRDDPSRRQPQVEPMAGCPLCGGTDHAPAFSSPDLLHGVPGLYQYVTCGHCRTVFQNPRVRPEDVGACYPVSYFTHEPAQPVETVVAGSLRDRLRRVILGHVDGAAAPTEPSPWVRAAGRVMARSGTCTRRARFGLLDPLGLTVTGARCLEIGPGRGHGLLNLTRIGWKAVGLEVDPVAARLAEQTSGCEVFAGDIADAPWPAQTFDLIYASHVFEHLFDPVDALQAMWTLLRPGGRLVLVYPNPRSLCARGFGSVALTWDPPRHTFLAPRGAVRDCLTTVGFSGVQVESLPRRARAYAGAAWQRRSPMRGVRRCLTPSVVRIAEVIGSATGLDIGEELLVTATRPITDPP